MVEVGGTTNTQVEEVMQHDEVRDVALIQGVEMTRRREEKDKDEIKCQSTQNSIN